MVFGSGHGVCENEGVVARSGGLEYWWSSTENECVGVGRMGKGDTHEIVKYFLRRGNISLRLAKWGPACPSWSN